jgi:hypothetical protein
MHAPGVVASSLDTGSGAGILRPMRKKPIGDRILEILSEGPIWVAGRCRLSKSQEAALKAEGIQNSVGVAHCMGTLMNGRFYVQFNYGSRSTGSAWPEWAYEFAHDSLLHGNKLWVFYRGTLPVGPKLDHVLIVEAGGIVRRSR